MSTASPKPLRPFLYNPLRQEPEDLERLFVARRALFERIFAEITSQKIDAVPQHQLIIGQRGMGKTTMLARLAVELRKQPYSDSFLALSFWEEQHIEVDRLSVFWLNCLDSLADAIDVSGNKKLAEELDKTVAKIRHISPEEDCARAAREAFTEAIEKCGRRPVLLIDNFNLLLAKLKKYDHVLRGFFTRHGAPIIIGAGITPPEDITDYDAAFYDGFKTILLHRLSLDEVREVIEHLAKENDEEETLRNLWRELPRLAALRNLSGGNPRTTLLIYRLCARGFGTDIYQDLETLLDETTPLFQSRFEQLSEQGQKLVARLARNWRPASAEAITELTGFPRGTVSPLLGRLEDDGIIEKVSLFDPERRDNPKDKRGGISKRVGYQLAERFFNIWLLMRSASRREREAIMCLARFIETMFPKPMRDAYARQLASETRLDLSQAIMALALASTTDGDDANQKRELRILGETAFVEIAKGVKDNLPAIVDPSEIQPKVFDRFEMRKRLEELVPSDAKTSPSEFRDLVMGSVSMIMPDSPSRWSLAKASSLSAQFVDHLSKQINEEYNKLIGHIGIEAADWFCKQLRFGHITERNNPEEIESSIASAPNAAALYALGAFVDETLPDLARKACEKAVELDETRWEAWQILAVLAMKSKDYSHAEACYKKAYSIDQTWVPLVQGYAQLLLLNLNRPRDAEPLYRRARELDPRDAGIANNLATVLQWQGGKDQEALAEFRRAVALDFVNPKPWINMGDLLSKKMGDYAGAETAYRHAISMTQKAGIARTRLAHLLQDHRNQFGEAEREYRRVIEDGEDEADTWIGLGNLLSGHLKRYDEAENAYRTAIDKFNEPVAWTMLGVMMMRYLNRLTDAEAAYRKALEIDPKLGLAWFNIGTLYALHFGRGADALEANERAVQFDPANAGYWNGLGNVKFDYLNDLDSAEAAFRKALELDPNEDAPRYNLAFLLRDYRLDFKAARSVLAEIKQPDRWKDSRILQAALFAAYEENWGQATDSLREALAELGDGGLPPNSQDDWFRASAVLLNLGYGEAFIEFLRAERSDICLLPWFSAVEAHQVGDRQMLLNIPTEARETAEFVFDQIAKRRANLPKRPKSET